MGTGYIPDAVIQSKLEKRRDEIVRYIERHIDAIHADVPVFFAKIISSLGKSKIEIPDQVFDEFIDLIALKILQMGGDYSSADIAKIVDHAASVRRNRSEQKGLFLAAGITLIRKGQFLDAASYLLPYCTSDVKVGCWHAYCYYMLYREGSGEPGFLPSDRWKYHSVARRLMGELGQWRPGFHRILSGELEGDPLLEEAFWLMIFSALEWLPEERWYLEVGIRAAKEEANEVILSRLLQLALIRFPHDLDFSREAYLRNFEEGELDGALSLVQEMERDHPLRAEPIYFGLRAAFFLPSDELFIAYREVASERQMPAHVLQMIDFAYMFLCGQEPESRICLEKFRQNFPDYEYFSQILDYLISGGNCGSEIRPVIFRAFDRFCMRMLQIHPW
ncbi:MAG: hypothetical protein RQ758_03130 [Methanomicrobiaceae archaeon]|nr:hypothetical protein [Methanomicrobiaceae archaeon]